MKNFLFAMMACCFTFIAYTQKEQPMLGLPAPAFTLKSLDGSTYSLDQFKGKYLVLHFATTWCPFCSAEAPYLEQLYKDYKDKNVAVMIVDVKEDRELVNRLFSRFHFTFPVLLDETGAISASYAPNDVLPDLARDEVPLASNLVIDKEGKIRFYSLLNTASFDAKLTQLRQKLDTLLAQEK